MQKIATAMGVFARRFIAVLVLQSFVLAPAVPVVQAATQPADSCPFCKRMGRKCTCHMGHSAPLDGPAFDAAQDCCGNGWQVPAVAPAHARLAAQTPSAIPLYPTLSEALACVDTSRTAALLPLWRYQRPPPV